MIRVGLYILHKEYQGPLRYIALLHIFCCNALLKLLLVLKIMITILLLNSF